MMNDSDHTDDMLDNVVFDLKLELAGLVQNINIDTADCAVKYNNITKVEIIRLPVWRTL